MAAVSTTASGPRRRARVRQWAGGFKERETWAAFAFLSPWLFGFFVFTAGPMVASLILSFTDYSIIQTTHNVGFSNYHDLIHDLSKRLRRSVALRPVHRQRRGQTGPAESVERPEVPGDRQHQAHEAGDGRGDRAELLLTEPCHAG